WAKQLAILAGVSQYGAMESIISLPSSSAQQQAQALTDVCGDELTDPVRNFVQLLAQNKRLSLLPEVYQLFDTLKSLHEQAVDVNLITAFALEDSSQEQLAQALSKKLARKVNVQSQVDKSLLAGVIIKAGDLVIDGSMRGRLEKL